MENYESAVKASLEDVLALSSGMDHLQNAIAIAAVFLQSDLTAGLRTRLNNIEYFPPNFEGIVLGCIDADFCK